MWMWMWDSDLQLPAGRWKWLRPKRRVVKGDGRHFWGQRQSEECGALRKSQSSFTNRAEERRDNSPSLILCEIFEDILDRRHPATKTVRCIDFWVPSPEVVLDNTLCGADTQRWRDCYRCNLSGSFVSLQQLKPHWQCWWARRLKHEGNNGRIIKALKISHVFFFLPLTARPSICQDAHVFFSFFWWCLETRGVVLTLTFSQLNRAVKNHRFLLLAQSCNRSHGSTSEPATPIADCSSTSSQNQRTNDEFWTDADFNNMTSYFFQLQD